MNNDIWQYFLLVLTGGSLMLLLSGFIIFLIVRYQKNLLREQEARLALEEKLHKQTLEAVLQTQEEERRRIGRDLHDEIGAVLSTARLQMRQIVKFSAEQQQIQQLAAHATELLDDLISNIRRTSAALMPKLLDHYGLVKAMSSMADIVNASKAVEVHFHFSGTELIRCPEKELALYRVLQELINNSLRHAQASAIEMQLVHQKGQLQMQYSDNGCGFDLQQAQSQEKQGLGLVNAETRITLLQGRFRYHTAPGQGVMVEAEVPWPTLVPDSTAILV